MHWKSRISAPRNLWKIMNELRIQNCSLADIELEQQFSLPLFVLHPPFVLLPYFSRHTWMRAVKGDVRQRNKSQNLSCLCQKLGTWIKTERKREICWSFLIINWPHVWLEHLVYIFVIAVFIWFVPPTCQYVRSERNDGSLRCDKCAWVCE